MARVLSDKAKAKNRRVGRHLTEVRGLLCNPCNLALGMFKDDPKVLVKALKYLTERAS